jgi:diphthamide biosynthesis methyltransferase
MADVIPHPSVHPRHLQVADAVEQLRLINEIVVDYVDMDGSLVNACRALRDEVAVVAKRIGELEEGGAGEMRAALIVWARARHAARTQFATAPDEHRCANEIAVRDAESAVKSLADRLFAESE